MSMRTLVYCGWMMIGIGVAILIGSAASGIAGGVLFGVGMLAALGGTGAFMIWLGKGWDTGLESAEELYKYGRPANATVKKVEDAQLDANGVRTAKLTVHVTPRNEGSYKTTQRVALPGGRVPTVGETVTIKFDPNSRKQFVLLEESYEVRDTVQQASDQMNQVFQGLAQPKS